MKGLNMKTMKSGVILASLFFILLSAQAVAASNWVEFYKGKQENVASYKKVTTKAGPERYVVKEVFSDKGREDFINERTKAGLSTEGYEKLANTQSLSEIDCQKNEIMNIAVLHFDANGKILSSYSVDNPKWVKIPKNPFFNTLIKEICK
jgi:hypothetical protein